MDILASLVKGVENGVALNSRIQQKKNPAKTLPAAKLSRVDENKGENYILGFGKSEIMPKDIREKKYYVAGYGAFNPATGILDPMTAEAIWIDDNSGKGGIVFVSVNCVGLFKYDVDIIRNMLRGFRKETGCRAINICSTHNHAGIDTMGLWGANPKTGRDCEYMSILRHGVVNAVKQAYADRKKGKLYLGYAKADAGMQRDDRLPQVFSDVITRLRFVPNDNSKETYIVNFASHSESLEGKNTLVSSDFPAYIGKEIEEEKHANFIYFVGAIGGLVRMWPQDEDNIYSAKKTGRRLGEIICAIEEETLLLPKISIARKEIYAEAQNPVLIGAAYLGIIPVKPEYTNAGPMKVSVKTELSIYKIDSLNIAMIPGELFPELAYGGYLSAEESAENKSPAVNPAPLTEISGDEKLLIVGLANDEIGYIPTPNDFFLHPSRPYIDSSDDRLGRGHYEETNSLGPNTAYFIADTFRELWEMLK